MKNNTQGKAKVVRGQEGTGEQTRSKTRQSSEVRGDKLKIMSGYFNTSLSVSDGRVGEKKRNKVKMITS